MAYAPFGEGYAGPSQFVQFTSTGNTWTVYDSENQAGSLEDFMFRRYSPSQGRWISPDPAGTGAVNPTLPQSWNRYAYVSNEPLNSTDPLGLAHGINDCYGCVDDNFGDPNATSYQINGVDVPSAVGAAYSSNSGAFFNCTSNCDKLNSGQVRIGGDGSITQWIAPYILYFDDGFLLQEHRGHWLTTGPSASGADDAHPGLALFSDGPQCQCGRIWRNADRSVKIAMAAEAAALLGGLGIAELGASTAGDYFFARGVGILNSNDYVRLGWAWYSYTTTGLSYGGFTYFALRVGDWHVTGP